MAEAKDLHTETVLHDLSFHAWMDALDTHNHPGELPWRERLTPKEQRMHAKQWNFNRLYGTQGGWRRPPNDDDPTA